MKNITKTLLIFINLSCFADPTSPDKLMKGYNNYLFANKEHKQSILNAYKVIAEAEGYSQTEYQDTQKKAICHGLNFTDARYKKKSFTQEECKMLTIGYIQNDYDFLKQKAVLEEIIIKDNNQGKQVAIIVNKKHLFNFFKTKQQQAYFLSFIYNIGSTKFFKDKDYQNDLMLLLANKNQLKEDMIRCEIDKEISKVKIKGINTTISKLSTCKTSKLLQVYQEFKIKHLSYSKDVYGNQLEGLKKRRQVELNKILGI